MHLSENDYKKLYKLQDKVFKVISGNCDNLYLTGGTALGRFFLNHRYSDDIDFFTNADPLFTKTVTGIRQILDSNFIPLTDKLILHQDFVRVWVEENDTQLKVEFVNDVKARWALPFEAGNIKVDNPGNILANKLTAIIGREEAKDVFDIIHLSLKYSFNWGKVFEQSIQKSVASEQDVAMRLKTFPIVWFEEKPWLKNPVNIPEMKRKLEIIADDFLFARDNSLGVGKEYILDATIHTPVYE